jgi:hypothetical protein
MTYETDQYFDNQKDNLMAENDPTVDQAFEYVTNNLNAIFGVQFTDDINVTLNSVDLMVKELRAAPAGDSTQHRYAALDAAIRIMSDAKDTNLILTRAKDIENYLSGTSETAPITS